MDLASVLGGGIAGALASLVIDILKERFSHGLKERLARLESKLAIQSQLASARLTKAQERRAAVLSRLHTLLDRTLEVNCTLVATTRAIPRRTSRNYAEQRLNLGFNSIERLRDLRFSYQ